MVAYLEVPELSKGAIASIKAANLLSIVTHRGEKQKQQKNKNAPHIQKKNNKAIQRKGQSRSRNHNSGDMLLFGRKEDPKVSTTPMQVE